MYGFGLEGIRTLDDFLAHTADDLRSCITHKSEYTISTII